MKQWEYEALQDALTKKSENNPYGRTGNFKREDGYKEGILAAKSILHSFFIMWWLSPLAVLPRRVLRQSWTI